MTVETSVFTPESPKDPHHPHKKHRDWHDKTSIILLGLTFFAALSAAIATGRQAYLGNKQLRVARDTLAVTQDTERRQLRAYITTVGGGATLGVEPITKNLLMHASIKLRNSGATPAYNMTVKIDGIIAPRDAVPFTTIGPINDEYGGHSIMGPGTEYESGKWIDYNPAAAEQLENGLKKTFMWGRVDYDDVFGTHRWLEFREVSSDQLGGGKWLIATHKLGEQGN
jgi:hypothetical protein